MAERTGLITFKGNPLTLVGNEVKVGQKAPDAELVANDLSVVKLSSLYAGKVCIITSVPSLDTAVCDMETRRFNEEAGRAGPGCRHPDREHGSAFCPETLVRRRGRAKRPNPVRLPPGSLRQSLWRAHQGAATARTSRIRAGQTGRYPVRRVSERSGKRAEL